MISIAICDDESDMLKELEVKLYDFFEARHMEINLFKFSECTSLLECSICFDIIFLDIEMKKPEEPDGMETARRLRSRDYNGYIIFITVLEEMVFSAFEVQAFDYLVKPLKHENFNRTMTRLLTGIRNNQEASLLIQNGNEHTIIPFSDIIFCEVINRKVFLHLKNNQVISYYEKLENLERKLDGRFYRCHRSYLLNLNYLISYKQGLAYMKTGESIPVSRLRSEEFSNVVLKYMKERSQ